MLLNYLKMFLRLFLKQTAFTLINILGLAVGLACCLVIALYVRHELSFDRFFTRADTLYRISNVSLDPAGVTSESAATFFPVAPLLEENFPVITEIARMRPRSALLSVGEETFYENEFRFVDPAFFRLFDFIWLEGDAASALTQPTDVVLTSSFANKYFGGSTPLGQTLHMSEGLELRVTGVIADIPANTHLSGTTFASTALRDVLEPERSQQDWFNEDYYVYVDLRPDTDLEQLGQQLAEFGRANIPTPGVTFTLKLDAIADIHLNPSIGDMKTPGSKLTIAVFTAVGIGILLVACANFINLSTARSAQRFGEIGLRLTLGARRGQLITQLLGESVLFVLLAILCALALVELSLPTVQAFLGLDLAFDGFADPLSLAMLLGAGILLGVLAGWYPALLMSRFRPAMALKKPLASKVRSMALKNVLVVMQFAIAIGMIVASTVIYTQMQFAESLEPGYARDRIVVVSTSDVGSHGRIGLLKERLLSGDITAAAMSESTPERSRRGTFVKSEGEEAQHRLAYYLTDFDYFHLYEIPLLAGRLPAAETPADLIRSPSADPAQPAGSLVLNVSAAREFGWTVDEAVGRLLFRNGGWYRVIGVVGDTIESAHAPAGPAMYAVPEGPSPGRFLSLKLNADDVAGTLAFIDRTWNEINPGEPILRTFLADNIAGRYQREGRLTWLAFLFAAIAVIISCMGLFGLASFNAERRIKEIGVRKVMGSSIWGIVVLLTSDFSRLVLLSNLIAWPLAYFVMNRWLENFAYRIDLTPLVFVGSGLIALCIAWVTVGGTAARAASQKPVLALRYE